MTRPQTFIWPYRGALKELDPKDLWVSYLERLLPCKDGVEHFARVFQGEHKDKEDLWEKYRLGSTAYLGTLVLLEDGDGMHIPLTSPPSTSKRSPSYSQGHLYKHICEGNLTLLRALVKAIQNKTHDYLLMKLGIRHLKKLSMKTPRRPYFRHGHANMVVFHLPSRHIFHLEPLNHRRSRDILLILERWLGSTIFPLVNRRSKSKPCEKCEKWTLTSNLDFSTHLSLFPQQTTSLCRLWSWIMGMTLVLNGVESTAELVSVLQVFSHHTHVIFKFFMLFHALTFPPSTCASRCEALNTLGETKRNILTANLRVPPILCPSIPVFHRETHYPDLLRSVEIDKPRSSLLLRLIRE